jgi:hypothetical protein
MNMWLVLGIGTVPSARQVSAVEMSMQPFNTVRVGGKKHQHQLHTGVITQKPSTDAKHGLRIDF